ncbi:MAG: hypothetical protein LBG27_02505 [Spirochaetaceae bacterium]|jgi:hypothetical protein|nr:hypothetical protein [Spirochaetaceae bacterium]
MLQKKFFLIGMTALLSVSLFLIGCDNPGTGDAGADGKAGSESVNGEWAVADLQAVIDDAAAAGAKVVLSAATDVLVGEKTDFPEANVSGTGKLVVAAAGLPTNADGVTAVGGVTAVKDYTLSNATGGGVISGLTVYVYGKLTVNGNSVAPTGTVKAIGTVEVAGDTSVIEDSKVNVSGADVTVKTGATLTVTAGKTLTVGKTVTVAQNANVNVASGGDYIFGADADGTNSGTITIKSGGQTYALGGSLAGDGHTVVETGGKAWTGDVLVIGASSDTWTVNETSRQSTRGLWIKSLKLYPGIGGSKTPVCGPCLFVPYGVPRGYFFLHPPCRRHTIL